MCAKIIPFKAIRPVRDKVHLVATRPYYSYTKQILTAKLIQNPYSFIHIINPEFKKSDRTKPNTIERFEKVRGKYAEFCDRGIFCQDQEDSFYLYRQTTTEQEFIGLIAGASVEEYNSGCIKIHEQTLPSREETFKMYLDVCGFNAEPVLLAHKDKQDIMDIYLGVMLNRPEYEYTSTDRVKHELWVISEPAIIQKITENFKEVKGLYIADGHHRSASSALLGEMRSAANPDHQGTERHNYFMACLISENLLKIYDYNRLVSDLSGLSVNEVLEKLAHNFKIQKAPKRFKPREKSEFSMYLDGQWYQLNLNTTTPRSVNPSELLDSRILSKLVLGPILGITDIQNDPRISFLNGKSGMKGLEKKVNKGLAKIAFGLYPVSVRDLMHVADTNNMMPPKSTYIEPKLRSGLTIYEL
jgi:uncharacterized protein (DUF1015 family)